MKGFIGLTAKEKEDILKQHVKPYDGYAVGNVNTNMYPLTVYDAARDKGGITVDNHGNPGVYRNHNINEIAAKNLHYDAIEEPYEFDSQGPGDPNLGYDVYIGDELIIPIELLSKGSHYKIECQCDSCGIKRFVIYKNYIKYGNEWGFYYCRKCSEHKRKKTLIENHGCEYPIQNKKILKKMRKTIIEKKKLI
jgi:hypothetical protein